VNNTETQVVPFILMKATRTMKIVVVGGCGSGKTTVASLLRDAGHEAWVVGQEHSAIADLWRRKDPEAVVFLDVSLETVRNRRGEHWPEWLYHRQVDRLKSARSAADVIVDTGSLGVEETIEFIERRLTRL
jgi:adenylate kinase family enzyme